MAAEPLPWVLDLDGVLWRGSDAVPGSAEAVAALRAAGHRVAFCTNNSAATPSDYVTKLGAMGIAVGDPASEILTSALAVATLVEPGERALGVAGAGVRQALEDRGASVVTVHEPEQPVDAVVVGFHRTFDYDALRRAARAVLSGARLVASNDDPRYPDHDGPAPGCGAILAAIERASGRTAEVAGKPNGPMADLVRARLGGGPGVVVGDSPGTDGGLATRLGWTFGLVLSGNSTASDATAAGIDPAWVGADLGELVDRHG